MRARNKIILGCLLTLVSWIACGQEEPFQFSSPSRMTNDELLLSLVAPTGRTYRIESATTPLLWGGQFTFPTNAKTSLQYTDSATPYLAGRLYRAVRVDGTNLVWGDHLITTNGDVIIQPRNHATFVMQWNGNMIYVDPTPTASYAGLPKGDLVLVTHNHSDHFSSSTIESVRKTNANIIVPRTIYNSGLTAAQKSMALPLAYGESTNVLGLNVEAVYAYNSNHAPLGFGNGYVVTIGGKRIYISGDTGNSADLRALTNIDVAFLCINLPFTMSVNEATNLVRAMQPKVVYPYHYRDQSNATTNAAAFKQRLGTDTGIEVRLRKWY